MSDLQQALRDNLKAAQDSEDNQKQLLTSELLPIDTALVDMASDKVRALTDHVIKRGTQKTLDLIKQKTGIDLLAKKEELNDISKNMLNNMNNRANDLMGQAQESVENTLNQGREGIHNMLNSFNELRYNIPEMPHIQPPIEAEEGIGDLLEKL